VFVSERGSSRVSVFSDQGRFLRALGSPGSGAGNLAGPYGVAVSAAGVAYVADSANNRLSAFDAGGDFRWALGLDVVPGAPFSAETCAGSCQAGASGFGIGEFSNLQAVAADCRGAVYVATLGRVDKFGEAGVQAPPCAMTDPPGGRSSGSSHSSGPPSNEFSFGRPKRNLRRGTLTLAVFVPGAGALAASTGRKLVARIQSPIAAGRVSVTVRAARRGVRPLRKMGRLTGILSVTFTPHNGDPKTKSLRVRLRKKPARRRDGGAPGKRKPDHRVRVGEAHGIGYILPGQPQTRGS
jgi:hypothetical protein